MLGEYILYIIMNETNSSSERKEMKQSFQKPTLEDVFSGNTDGNVHNVRCVCFSPDSSKLVIVGDGDKMIVICLSDGIRRIEFAGHLHGILGCDYSPKGDLIATGSLDKIVRLWNYEDRNSSVMVSHKSHVNCVRFHKDGEQLISGGSDYTTRIWNIERKECILTLSDQCGWVYSLDIFPKNHQTFVSGHGNYESGCAKLWDLRIGSCVHTLIHNLDVNSVQFHPNSFLIATASAKTVKIFDMRTNKLFQNYEEHKKEVTSTTFHPNGKYLISGSKDDDIKIYNLVKKEVVCTIDEHISNVTTVKFSSNGDFFASGSFDNRVILWKTYFGEDENRLVVQSKLDLEERINSLREGQEGVFIMKVGTVRVSLFSKLLLEL